MYCPKCLNNTLSISSKGVINITINGKQMDAGRFLFNLESQEKKQQLKPALKAKLQEFFKWYSGFQNKAPITFVSIDTSDMRCEEGCGISAKSRFSVIDVLIPKAELLELLAVEAKCYGIEIQLQE
ncbi:MAG: hypothetical protein CME71_05815 [Halobacteriovorax sp.]|nr:hypothetical protein [Halobacteriovorax sp.]